MNERARDMINAPGSITPKNVLETASGMRKAINRNINGGNYGVYCLYDGERYRITRVKMEKGVLKVRTINGDWLVNPEEVWSEG